MLTCWPHSSPTDTERESVTRSRGRREELGPSPAPEPQHKAWPRVNNTLETGPCFTMIRVNIVTLLALLLFLSVNETVKAK